MSEVKRTGGGRFDPKEPPVYFAVGVPQGDAPEHTLMALDSLDSKAHREHLVRRLDEGKKVLLDSGVFAITNAHARTYGVTMDDALRLHPDDIDGFDVLWERYIGFVKEHEDRLWGYIELDQGGAERKRETRARIEAEGLVPIPVYHPIVDGWDYFDELASQYDRICVGNIVQASTSERNRLLATLWERHREYPDLWIHVLGLTANQTMGTYYFNSCDSSSLLYMIRFGAKAAPIGLSALRKMGYTPPEYSYLRGDAEQQAKGENMVWSCAHFITQAWRVQHEAQSRFGAPLPPVEEWEEQLR